MKKPSLAKKVTLDLHDFSIMNNRLDLLFKLKEFYPKFKVSMFMIPYDIRYEMDKAKIYREDALKKIKENLDWIQIIPHGLSHIPREMEKADYTTFRYGVLKSIDEIFKKDGLPYEKGFCAPQWLWNTSVVHALDDEGWWGAIDKNQPGMPKTKKFYTYTHGIDQPFWKSNLEVLNLHGHLDQVSANDLEENMINMLKLPSDIEWGFVTDYIQNADTKD